jgi:hypothetical protein
VVDSYPPALSAADGVTAQGRRDTTTPLILTDVLVSSAYFRAEGRRQRQPRPIVWASIEQPIATTAFRKPITLHDLIRRHAIGCSSNLWRRRYFLFRQVDLTGNATAEAQLLALLEAQWQASMQ